MTQSIKVVFGPSCFKTFVVLISIKNTVVYIYSVYGMQTCSCALLKAFDFIQNGG